MKSFRELDAWVKAMALTDAVYSIVEKLPNVERYALSDQLRRAAVSIPSNIAEGFGRDTHKDFAHFVTQARGSLYEVDTQLEIAVRRGWLEDSAIPRELMNDVSKLLNALLRHLRTSDYTRATPPVPSRGTRHEARSTASAIAQSTRHEARGTAATPSPHARGTNQ